jgi:hypothetical protein
MPVLISSKHERFAQLRSKGLSAVDAYIAAGYSKSNAQSNASRLSLNDGILARIKELQTAVAERVVAAEARRRSWRVELLQNRIDKAIALSQARATMYAQEMGESYQFQVLDRAAELAAIADGCTAAPVFDPPKPADWKDAPIPAAPEYPKTMIHPGFPIGGATGLLMKDYRGKNAEQVIWKFDAALEARIADNLKQVAIEEGQWTEKREVSGEAAAALIIINLNLGRQRVVEEKKAALARGEIWCE